MAGGIKLNLKGFEKMLSQIQDAGRNADPAARRAVNESARIVEDELRTQCQAAGVPDDITREIKTTTSTEGDGRYSAKVGWKLGNYDPRNPSTGYKAIFLNYGTVRRQTRRGKNRGEIRKPARNQQFIFSAKKKAQSKVRKLQKQMLEEITGGLDE
ncbi:MAG: HK97 gp10 family phage protein [Prevotella sp.]|nr:HK97 gp10 family phage protein [Prevotella sp.]